MDLVYKRDLSRAYRQFAVDPYDYNLLGIEWQNSMYIDTATGLRSAAQACQHITSAIASIAKKNGFLLLNYFDDFARVENGGIHISSLFIIRPKIRGVCC